MSAQANGAAKRVPEAAVVGRVVVPATAVAVEVAKVTPLSAVQKPSGGIKDDMASAAATAAALGVAGLTALNALADRHGVSVPSATATPVTSPSDVAQGVKSAAPAAPKVVGDGVGVKRTSPASSDGAASGGGEDEPDAKKKKKAYPCEICGVILKSFGGHTGHMLGHSGEKPHSCKTCNKSFRHVNALRNHERIHTGIKPYKCESCDKSFVEQVRFQTMPCKVAVDST